MVEFLELVEGVALVSLVAFDVLVMVAGFVVGGVFFVVLGSFHVVYRLCSFFP